MKALPPVTLLETRLFPLEKCAYFDDILTPLASLLTPSLCDNVYNYCQKVLMIWQERRRTGEPIGPALIRVAL